MWHEIKDKANKMLLRILFVVKNSLSDESQTLDELSSNAFFQKERHDVAFIKHWKCIFETFEENQLI